MNAREFFYDFGKALYHVDALYGDFAKAAGVVSPTLLWVLYALNDGKEHTQREICTSWDLPKSTVNTVTTELKARGFVELMPIRGKRREMTVALTEDGKAYADQVLADIYRKEAAAFASLTEDDLKVIASIEKISALLKKEDER